MKSNIPYDEAANIARVYCKLLEGTVRCISIAGSLRRKKAFVGDIEIVCVPNLIEVEANSDLGLFSPTPTIHKTIRDQEFIYKVNHAGPITKGSPTGRMVQQTFWDVPIDLFITNINDYGRQLAIRTGPYLYSHHVIAAAWVKKGWVGTSEGLRQRKQCSKISGKWKVLESIGEINAQRPPAFYTEQSFYEYFGIPYALPEKRYW